MKDCEKCLVWNMAAKESGYQSGMCEDCFNKYFVHFKAEWGGTARCMTSDGRNVNIADELNRLEKDKIEKHNE